jgi:ribosome-binding protein aMBF1 (putative translation factor)
MNSLIKCAGNMRSKLVVCAAHRALIASALLLFSCATVAAQRTKTGTKTKPAQSRPVDELARLRDEFIKATKDYKASLEKLLASYEKNVAKAETRLGQSRELFAQGLISKNDLASSERALAEANDKLAETRQRTNSADAQIADALLEAVAERSLAKSKPIAKGSLVRTAAYIRFNGGASWALSDAWKVQRFFLDTFKKPLPVAVFGQGSIHDRWRLDHHNAMDVSLHPDGAEGQALLSFLRNNGIPFLAFREAIPGTATGPHIHIGRPSHRY